VSVGEGEKEKKRILNRQERDGPLGIGGVTSGEGGEGRKKTERKLSEIHKKKKKREPQQT
jgi:hypothetical protein